MSRLKLINNNNKNDDLLKSIVDGIEKCKGKLCELDRIINYLMLFEKKGNEGLIDKLGRIINKLREKEIVKFLEEKE